MLTRLVSASECGRRSNSCAMSLSMEMTCRDSALCEICNALAAFVKLPCAHGLECPKSIEGEPAPVDACFAHDVSSSGSARCADDTRRAKPEAWRVCAPMPFPYAPDPISRPRLKVSRKQMYFSVQVH